MANKYPIYIISKGRYEKTLTADIFKQNNLDFLIAVEPQEYDLYCKKLGSKYVLRLPFANLGLGSYPARNFCWEHAKENGYDYHWLFDDNVQYFAKWINGKRKKIDSIVQGLVYVESFVIKNNITIGGFEEPNFVVKPPPRAFKRNCHVYSAMLIKNNIPFRWRLKYNEDVDLCLQVLHNGGSTASCVYYMADKVSTSAKMKGGNQTELYQGNKAEKNLLKAKMLEAVWPQYAKTVMRFGRHHHLINWKQFKKQIK
tara:strand:- start:18 stop:785 length:768 start_codon:yes stop_codon:yes gene_type:complete